MDVGSWCNAGHRHGGWTRNFSETTESDDFVPFYSPLTGSKSTPIWRLMWRKIKKEKKKILERSYSTTVQRQRSYDIHAYAQNFDESSTWDDSDCLSSRSFSARFAVPSRIFGKNEGLLDWWSFRFLLWELVMETTNVLVNILVRFYSLLCSCTNRCL